MASQVVIPEIKKMNLTFGIRGISPLIQHQFDEKSRRAMREKHAGKRTRNREVRDPEAEFRAAMYLTEDGKYGLHAMALKNSILKAAHKDIGIPRTTAMQALFVHCSDANLVIEMDCSEPIMREDVVRVGPGSTDLRYRPEFKQWGAVVSFTIDAGLLQPKDVLTLVDRAGFGVGVNEWRPEKGGEYGRFEIDRSVEVIAEPIDGLPLAA